MAKFNAGDRAWARNTEYITEPDWCQAILLSFDATHAHCALLSTGELFSVTVSELKRFTYWHSRKENKDKAVPCLWQVDVSFISADKKQCSSRTFWPEFDNSSECINFVSKWLAIKEPFVHENMTSISAIPAERNPVTGGWKTW